MTVDDDDEYWEHTVVDWYLADDGLPVEGIAQLTRASPEQAVARLDLRPRSGGARGDRAERPAGSGPWAGDPSNLIRFAPA